MLGFACGIRRLEVECKCEVLMGVLMKVLIRGIVGVMTVGLLGCGCLFSSPLNSANPYPNLDKAQDLQYRGKYKAAIAEYERAAKKFPRFPVDTKIIHVSFPTFLKYNIAFCYAKLAEVEGDVSFYIKAETVVRESYERAIDPFDLADVLYLWGYILFKQARYEEARAKFEEALIGITPQNKYGADFIGEVLFGLGKAHLELGNEPAAQQTFVELEARIQTLLRTDNNFYARQVLFGLGKTYMELGDKPAARRVFAQFLELIEIELQDSFVGFDAEIFYEDTLYRLGHVYLELGDETAAQRAFAQLLEHYSDSPHKAEVERLLEKQ